MAVEKTRIPLGMWLFVVLLISTLHGYAMASGEHINYDIGAKDADHLAGVDPTTAKVAEAYRREILRISVDGHPELKIQTGAERSAAERGNAVPRAGSFFYPYLLSPYTGGVQGADRTVDESRGILMWRLVSYPVDSHLEVSIAASLSDDVSGAIVLLGTLSATRIPMMVFDVISPAMLEQCDQLIASLGNTAGHTSQYVQRNSFQNLLNFHPRGQLL